MINIYQGDSSDLLVLNGGKDWKLGTSWTAKLVVVASEDDPTPLLAKDFDKDEANNRFVTMLLPEETTLIDPGDYLIGMQIENKDLHFRREIRDKLKVLPQIVES